MTSRFPDNVYVPSREVASKVSEIFSGWVGFAKLPGKLLTVEDCI